MYLQKNPHYCGLINLIPGVDLTPDKWIRIGCFL